MDAIAESFSTPTGAVAQCVGFVAMGIALFMYAFHSRKSILLAKLTADLLWVVHYFLLGAFSGSVINAVNAVREGVFYHKEKKWASSIVIPMLFVAVNAALTALSWEGWISLLPLFGSSINVVGLWCASPKRMRMLAIPALSLWEIYSILVASVPSMIVNAFGICSAVYGLVRDAVQARKN